MKNLAKQVNPNTDVFNNQSEVSVDIVKEYFERNERKKADEKWLKANKGQIQKAMNAQGKSKEDFEDIRVSITVPDASNFDNDKIMEFLKIKGLDMRGTKRVVDEEKLEELIELGEIDLDELKEHAWVEKKGAPRMTVKKVKRSGN